MKTGHKKVLVKKAPMSGRIWERLIPLSRANHQWDIDFWQAQSPEVRFSTIGTLVADAYLIKGKKVNVHTFRLQRTVENIKRREG